MKPGDYISGVKFETIALSSYGSTAFNLCTAPRHALDHHLRDVLLVVHEGLPRDVAVVLPAAAVAALDEGLDLLGLVAVRVVHPQVERVALGAGVDDGAGEGLAHGGGVGRRAVQQGLGAQGVRGPLIAASGPTAGGVGGGSITT